MAVALALVALPLYGQQGSNAVPAGCSPGDAAPGTSVLVTGAGPVGLIAAQTARAYGADTVTVTDVNKHRLHLAERLGLATVDVAQTSLVDAGIEADVLLECSGNARATWDAVSTMARAGRVVLSAWAATPCSCRCPTSRTAS